MSKRFVAIWFRYLTTDWHTIHKSEWQNTPGVLMRSSHGQMVITAMNAAAETRGIYKGMALADARSIVPLIQAFEEKPDLTERLLKHLAEWCIRFTPFVSVNLPDGLILDVSGCSHLWGGDTIYLAEIAKRLEHKGYHVQLAMADTIGAAWASSRFARQVVIGKGLHTHTLLSLPPAALRVDNEITQQLHKLGLWRIGDFVGMPRNVLRRRFGTLLVQRLNQAMGLEEEFIQPVEPIEPYQERLTSLEPIVTRQGIEIALKKLLQSICAGLCAKQKGLRSARFRCYRTDGKTVSIEIATSSPSSHLEQLFKLFEFTLSTLEPGPGIELFVLEAPKVENNVPSQEKFWEINGNLNHKLSVLLDRLTARLGPHAIAHYLPVEHYLPERSFKSALTLDEKANTIWKTDKPRPLHLLPTPEHIEVTAPIPDYPPMFFRYKGKLHKIAKADGPERIEQEWWIRHGRHRDYYSVEDEQGKRYWLFRSGHYDITKTYRWFIHGFFV